MVTRDEGLPIKRQCELLGVNRSSFYYEPVQRTVEEREWEEHVKRRLDYWHTRFCWMGSRNLLKKLVQDDGVENIGRQRVRRYMQEMGIYSVYPKPNLSQAGKGHRKFPYLLRNKAIWIPNQVWLMLSHNCCFPAIVIFFL